MSYPTIDGPSWISQGYGCTDYDKEWVVPTSRCPLGHFHTGIDLAADCGLPILAVRGGTVVAIGIQYLGPFAVGIRDDEGLFHVYGHGSGNLVSVGQVVDVGDHILNVDTLGASSGCHLHYAVRTDGAFENPDNTVNPVPFLEEFMALKDDVAAIGRTVGEIHNLLNWGTPVGGAVPQGYVPSQVAKLDGLNARTGEIHNLLNWGTPVGGAVPQGWTPTALEQLRKDVDAIKTKIGA
jgi:hypothetical protein